MCVVTIPLNEAAFTLQECLSARIDLLQSTLSRVRHETENEISRLRDELVEKNRTLERLQEQLLEQRDYEHLKKQRT
jgi:predicted RNase H-like nuclease (RuvC/YqgF family)